MDAQRRLQIGTALAEALGHSGADPALDMGARRAGAIARTFADPIRLLVLGPEARQGVLSALGDLPDIVAQAMRSGADVLILNHGNAPGLEAIDAAGQSAEVSGTAPEGALGKAGLICTVPMPDLLTMAPIFLLSDDRPPPKGMADWMDRADGLVCDASIPPGGALWRDLPGHLTAMAAQMRTGGAAPAPFLRAVPGPDGAEPAQLRSALLQFAAQCQEHKDAQAVALLHGLEAAASDDPAEVYDGLRRFLSDQAASFQQTEYDRSAPQDRAEIFRRLRGLMTGMTAHLGPAPGAVRDHAALMVQLRQGTTRLRDLSGDASLTALTDAADLVGQLIRDAMDHNPAETAGPVAANPAGKGPI